MSLFILGSKLGLLDKVSTNPALIQTSATFSNVLYRTHQNQGSVFVALPVHYDGGFQRLFSHLSRSDVIPQSIKGPADNGWF